MDDARPSARKLIPTLTQGAAIDPMGENAWRFTIPAGPQGHYRVAQLDDYGDVQRSRFPYRAPVRMVLQARVSNQALPGTWGFGFWNNPFGMAIVRGVEVLRLPALPNAAWFFYGSAPNYLSLTNDLPANGWMAMTFRSPRLPPALLALGLPVAPLLLVRPVVRFMRFLGRSIVRQSSFALPVDPTEWHQYGMEWQTGRVSFTVDGRTVLETALVPAGPLGFVAWVDNQWAALLPSGKIGFGTLATPQESWLEIRSLERSFAM